MVASPVRERVRDFWAFYQRYTDTTIHTAGTVALAIFGILVFVDPWFAAVAIAAYVVPPVVLYAIEPDAAIEKTARTPDEAGVSDTDRSTPAQTQAPGTDRRVGSERHGDTDSDRDDGDTDSDSDDGDTDSDSDDGDTDSDHDG